MTPAKARAEALRRFRAVREDRGTFLDLGDLPLEAIPDELGEIPGLRILALGKGKPLLADSGLAWALKSDRPFPRYCILVSLAGLTVLTRSIWPGAKR